MLSKRALRWAAIPAISSLALVLTGCDDLTAGPGLLPPDSVGATNHTGRIIDLWVGSWAILWVVGIIAWALMIWAMIVYRRRKGDTKPPAQLRYNNPIETLFTIVPLILVIGFFAFTARDMAAIEKPNDADVKIEVIAKQWSWDFNYVDANVYDSGIQAQFTGTETYKTKDDAGIPVLWLPLGKSVEIDLRSRDVIHSFWVVDFLYKKDMFPGRWNKIYFTPEKLSSETKSGYFEGKCAELCGESHSLMLFNVKVVTPEEYEAHLADLAAKGQVGQLGSEFERNQNLPGDDPNVRG